jgi:hypothetical protein
VCYLDQSAESRSWSIALASVVALAAFFATKLFQPFQFASYERAKELATMAGYNAKGMALLEIQFGMVQESKARDILTEAEAQDLAELEQALEKRKSALHGLA